jgi:hypothetical protein
MRSVDCAKQNEAKWRNEFIKAYWLRLSLESIGQDYSKESEWIQYCLQKTSYWCDMQATD